MVEYKNEDGWIAKAANPLTIIIVGAGVAGLTAAIGLHKSGHKVIVLEQVPEIAEVGAGIQMAPNAARVLARLGLLEALLEKTALLHRNSLRRYANNQELMTVPLMPGIGEKFGAPLGVIHRGDLQRIIIEGAKGLGIDIRVKSKVVAVDDDFAPRVKLASGEWISGDVVLGADGIKSHVRAQMAEKHGVRDRSLPTGDAAYRILIPREKMDHDEAALELLDENAGLRWIGPGGHIMAYPLKPVHDEKTGEVRNTLYNMVLLHPAKPDMSGDESWTNPGSKKEMLEFYQDWDPLIQNLLSYVPEGEVMEWTLNSHRPLPSWIEGKVALLGDACHPMYVHSCFPCPSNKEPTAQRILD